MSETIQQNEILISKMPEQYPDTQEWELLFQSYWLL